MRTDIEDKLVRCFAKIFDVSVLSLSEAEIPFYREAIDVVVKDSLERNLSVQITVRDGASDSYGNTSTDVKVSILFDGEIVCEGRD